MEKEVFIMIKEVFITEKEVFITEKEVFITIKKHLKKSIVLITSFCIFEKIFHGTNRC
ncbi:hypothetical protein [Chryseobacterium angstadtii]|uniref:hypothetical protein n=1 Tax=Chryseobacterium angstadtii TaxID=558151 RepID=UPI000A576C5D|nr:hypothetical protein [Chryseobacterium angstadtii]